MTDDPAVYVSGKKLDGDNGNPPHWHADPDCYQVDAMEDVREMPLSEAEEECSRQARCCSLITALEDLD